MDMRLLFAMYNDGEAIEYAERTINRAVERGDYVTIEMEDGTVVRIDKPIRIRDISTVYSDRDGRYHQMDLN